MQDHPPGEVPVPEDLQLDPGVLISEADATSGDTTVSSATGAVSDTVDELKDALAEEWKRMRGVIGPF